MKNRNIMAGLLGLHNANANANLNPANGNALNITSGTTPVGTGDDTTTINNASVNVYNPN